jgi:AcrR family transcriptional regulator
VPKSKLTAKKVSSSDKKSRAVAPRTRRTNSERSSETRRKLFDASISCLHEFGYAATTTAMVAERAGVSRGAMNHHFATKVDLMVAVVEYVYARDINMYRESLIRIPQKDHMHRLLDLAWTMISGDGGQAVLHVMLAMQGDAELGVKLPPVIRVISEGSRQGLRDLAKAAGLKNQAVIDASSVLHLAALRGLAIESIIAPGQKNIAGALKLLHVYQDHLINTLGKGD